jgi:release factor glutamine methyltransferase
MLAAMSSDYRPRMSEERVNLLPTWHDRAYETQRSSLPARMSFMGLKLHIDEGVFAPHGHEEGDPFHQAVEAEVHSSDRVLDMGTGSGVSGILAARAGADVVAVDINPKSVECASRNAARNAVSDKIIFVLGDLFDGVEGDFDLIVFDPPFRWFKPRDLLETGIADENYRALTRFMTEAKGRLRPGGRILLHFGSSGDIDYLYELIERAGFNRDVIPSGEATRDGMTAHYYTIRLTA